MSGPSEHYFSRKPASSYKKTVISEYVRGVTVELAVSSGVFSRRGIDRGTRLLIESLEIPGEGTVLDVGCGYGVIGIVIALVNPRLKVYMVDINERAVRLARENVKRNNVDDRVIVLAGDLYDPVKDLQFDMIVSNPPYSAGMNVVRELIRGAYERLRPGGTLQLVVRKGANAVKSVMFRRFGNVEVLARGGGYKVFKSTRL